MPNMRSTLLLVVLVTSACNSGSVEQATDTMKATSGPHMDNYELQLFGADYAEAWSSQQPDRVASFFEPDGSLTVNKGEPAVGTDAITQVAAGFMKTFPDLTLLMDSLVTGPDGPSFHWTLIGTNTGPNGTGNSVCFSGVEHWTMSGNGRVQVSDGSFDAAEYERQLAKGVDASE